MPWWLWGLSAYLSVLLLAAFWAVAERTRARRFSSGHLSPPEPGEFRLVSEAPVTTAPAIPGSPALRQAPKLR